MAELTTLFDFHVRPDAVPTAAAVIADTLVATRAFPGCLGIDVIVDVADETHFVLVEHWDGPESDAAYRAWRSTPEGRSSLSGIVDGRPTATLFTSVDA